MVISHPDGNAPPFSVPHSGLSWRRRSTTWHKKYVQVGVDIIAQVFWSQLVVKKERRILAE